MELSRVMRTTPSTRKFTDDPVPDDVLYAILDDARFAPNGGNRQSWHVIVVRDPGRKRRIAELYDLGMREYAGHVRAGKVPFRASEAYWRNPPDAKPDPVEQQRPGVDHVQQHDERHHPARHQPRHPRGARRAAPRDR